MLTEGSAETSDTRETTEHDPDLAEEARDLVSTSNFRRGQILHAGVVLGLFDVIDHTATPAREIADQLDSDPDRSYRLLRALAAIGVLREQEHRRFSITSLGEFFQADHPETVADYTLLKQSSELISAMLHLPDIVRDGGPDGFVREFECPFYEFAEKNPDFADRFHRALSGSSYNKATERNPVLDALDSSDFPRGSHVCDIGGGRGRFLCSLLAAHPHQQGTVFERPDVVADRDHLWAYRMGVEDRCTYVGGDMFEEVPAADAYFLKGVLGNLTDDECKSVFSNIHRAATPDARVFSIQYVISDSGESDLGKLADISQMVFFGGRHRTKEELAELLERTNWELVEMRRLKENGLNLVESRKA